MRLLLVEDDEMLALSLTRFLRSAGFAVDHVSSAQNARAMGLQEDYRAAVLDIGLPDGSGLEVLETWRQARSEVPVLLLTARGGWQDKVNGLKAGADDYLAKPFHAEELVARINALIRRSEGRVHKVLQASGFELDEERKRVRTPEGAWHGLTGTEFRLLRCLMARPGRIFSKEELLEQLYNLDADPSHNVIEAYIRRLRRLIGRDSITTLRGQGYVFDTSQ
ncbi:response regulator transcription factor [Hydrocarboniclastica marina]|uniref:DNA-binding response regulator n=1 Tax=Hydrocarboniclastica marina TaxID=2259620 RepID=A0A4V1D9B0_9ALTE|nr:response regulator transcription factor [Hydrocarboniclastica marina]QCF28060.1 DNA-binding response regulator [Hydrocarboniclastica marina]